MRRRVVSVTAGLVGLLVFCWSCAWVAADGRDVPPRVLALMLCLVGCMTVVAMTLWVAQDAERFIAAVSWLSAQDAGSDRPSVRSVR